MDFAIGREFFAVSVAVSMVGAHWFAIYNQDRVNEMRDAVLTGRWKGHDITIEHRAMIMTNDWFPYHLGMGLSMLAYASILLSIPFFYGLTWDLIFICAIGSLVSLVAASSALIFSVTEYRSMRTHLARAGRANRP